MKTVFLVTSGSRWPTKHKYLCLLSETPLEWVGMSKPEQEGEYCGERGISQ